MAAEHAVTVVILFIQLCKQVSLGRSCKPRLSLFSHVKGNTHRLTRSLASSCCSSGEGLSLTSIVEDSVGPFI